MTRPTTKSELLALSAANLERLVRAVDALPEATRASAFQAEIDNQSRSPRDVLAHLHAWHRLLLGWYAEGMAGGRPAMPAAGYTWRQTPELNRAIWEEFAHTEYAEVLGLLLASHARVTDLIERHDDEELFTKGRFAWTGGTTLGAFLVSATSSHYDWGVKTLRAISKTI